MSIAATNRILNPRAALKAKVNLLVGEFEREKKYRRKKSFVEVGKRLAPCSQCKRYFDKKIADEQIKNKRENAPICIPCIMGIPRREITTDRKERWSEKAKERFIKYKEKYHG